jgi:hypothetical protein
MERPAVMNMDLRPIGRVVAAGALAFSMAGCAATSSIVRAMDECQSAGTGSSNVSLGGTVFALSPKSMPQTFVAAVDLGAQTPPQGIHVNVEDDLNLTKNSTVKKNDHVGMLGALQCNGSNHTELFVPSAMTLNGTTMPATPKPTPTAQPTK